MSKAFLEVKTTKNIKKLKREFGADYSEISLGDGAVQLSGKSGGKYYTLAVSPSAMRYNGENAMFSVVHDEKSKEQKMFVGEREFSIPESDGTIATQEWVEKNAGSSSGSSSGGTKLYKHTIGGVSYPEGCSDLTVVSSRAEPYTLQTLLDDFMAGVKITVWGANGMALFACDHITNMGHFGFGGSVIECEEFCVFTDTVTELSTSENGEGSGSGGTKLYKHTIIHDLDPSDSGAPKNTYNIVSYSATPITTYDELINSWRNAEISRFMAGDYAVLNIDGNGYMYSVTGAGVENLQTSLTWGVFTDTVTEL